MAKINIASIIEHTLLSPVATIEDFRRLCDEAAANNFYAVCVPPFVVKSCKEALAETDVKVCSVAGFPLGYNFYLSKAVEVKQLINLGADEVDCVINLSALKSKDYSYIENEIRFLRKAAAKKILKIIIETSYLSEGEKIKISKIILKSGADFIKTSTGFAQKGADVEDIKLIKSIIGNNMRIKASGGISAYGQAVAMINAGASRLGTSKSLKIIQ
ncbi:MAG: deoxyribose-phosphate aldolase [Endomicrobiaceae bacterium]|nr:deoxyribose-phosphate aldolase [Endomicrobiaceae bacterium]MDD3729576.1 deoxyribose-phosphate aldolase [Endomicrobiaceae bacterium]MDD4165632.1 deoxyribose-phosphate aldolase [Endomicrobiaceae bacterium]